VQVGRNKRRRAIRWSHVALVVHNWLGLKLALILAVVLLSGTLAVFRFEIDRLVYPELRVTPAPSLASLDAIVAAVTAAYPDWGLGDDIPTGIGAGNLAIGIVGVSPDRGVRTIWVDPYRAAVQGDTPFLTPGFFLAKLHRDLFIPEWGIVIVCALALVVAVSLITGLIAYRRFWLGFLRRPRLRNLRILMIDLHKLVGLWTLWFGIVIALTGLWYFWTLVGEQKLGFPQAVERRALPDPGDDRLQALGPAAPKPVPLAVALARATARYPDFVATYVTLPDRHGAPLVFHGNRGEVFALNATAIAVDSFSGEVLGANLARDAPLSLRIGAMVNPLHYGDFGGFLSKTVWFVFGLALSGVAITGVVIFWCRTSRAAVRLMPSLLRAFHPWRGAMGWLKPLNWAALAVAAIGAVLTAQFYSQGLASLPARYGHQDVGPWRLGATLIAGLGDASDPVKPAAHVLAVVQYCPDCWEDIRRLWVDVGPVPPADGDWGQRVQGRPGFASARVMLPGDLHDQRLWITAEGWDRRIHQSSWPLRKPAN
jgi:uncharacterized iron-regulated membrane protein